MKKQLFSLMLLFATATGVVTSANSANAQQVLQGLATWYGPGYEGNRTANGEVFDPTALTAAHRSLPFGTQVQVTNIKTGRSVVVRINDRLGDPNILIDLSSGAAKAIGLTETSPVKMQVLPRQ